MMRGDEMIYPRPQEMEWQSGEFMVGTDTYIYVASHDDLGAALLFQEEIAECFGVTIPLRRERQGGACIHIGRCHGFNEAEGYTLTVSQDSVEVLGVDKRGTLYGVQTLLQIGSKQGSLVFPAVKIRDWPYMPVRGVHLYLPARESIEGFKRIIRMLAYIKMNTLVIEVGGGMEYEQNPEINQSWERFCKDAHAYPGGPRALQGSEAYWKNSLHTELGGGSYLRKAEVRDIVNFAKDLGFDVIPEIQALSHCYYLVMAHREIAERPHEPFPDTYCPSNPESYKLYFEVADEVIEVFEPEWVSIGHDEVRILGQCPLCKEKKGEELLAYEVNTLYDYYKSKDIEVMMWGEKLQNFIGYNGRPYGGVFQERRDKKGRYWSVPATYKAIDMVPKDILMIDWYHGLSDETEKVFNEKGFKEFFGNFHGSLIADWDIRSSSDNVLGAEVSTWCLADEYTIARNNTIFEFVFSAGILWYKAYNDALWEEEYWKVVRLMPKVKEMLQGIKYPLRRVGEGDFETFRLESGPEQIQLPVGTIKCGIELPGCSLDVSHINGIQLNGKDMEIEIDSQAKSLVFLHAAYKPMEFIPSWDFKDMSEYIIGRYQVLFEDGSVEDIHLHYGIHIGHIDMDWARYRSQEGPREVDELTGESGKGISPYYKSAEGWSGSLMYFTIPLCVHTPESIKTLYAYEWINTSNKKILSVKAKSTTEDTSQKISLFGIKAII